jgi:aconitate hydratase
VPVTSPAGESYLDNGAVTLAAITSCTNTSNPSVMIAAGLLARKARDKGLKQKPWVKTTLGPGSKVVTDYYEKSGLDKDLEGLGFYTVGYGCTICIGNSGPLIEEVSAAINENDLAVTAVLSGNRNFEGRISPDVKMNYLASPPLVVAYALAGSMNFDFETDPLGRTDGNDVFLKDIWPSPDEVQEVIDSSISRDQFIKQYATVFDGDERWTSLPTPRAHLRVGCRLDLRPQGAVLRGHVDGPHPGERHPRRTRDGDPRRLGHHRPHLARRQHQGRHPAAQYLTEHGVAQKDFNSYGSRRGNHEVMIRGTFANIRLKNELVAAVNDGQIVEGGFTRDFTQAGGPQSYIFDACENYRAEGTPLVVFGGKEYGSARRATGPRRARRCWASRRSSPRASSASTARTSSAWASSRCSSPRARAGSLGLDGTEIVSIEGLEQLNEGVTPKTVKVTAAPSEFSPRARRRSSSTPRCASTPPVRPTTTATAASCSTCCVRSSERRL